MSHEQLEAEARNWCEANDNGDYYWWYSEDYMVYAFITARTMSPSSDQAVRDAISAQLLEWVGEVYDPINDDEHARNVADMTNAVYRAARLITETTKETP